MVPQSFLPFSLSPHSMRFVRSLFYAHIKTHRIANQSMWVESMARWRWYIVPAHTILFLYVSATIKYCICEVSNAKRRRWINCTHIHFHLPDKHTQHSTHTHTHTCCFAMLCILLIVLFSRIVFVCIKEHIVLQSSNRTMVAKVEFLLSQMWRFVHFKQRRRITYAKCALFTIFRLNTNTFCSICIQWIRSNRIWVVSDSRRHTKTSSTLSRRKSSMANRVKRGA